MREKSWNDCMSSMSSRRVSPDTKRAESLSETAEERIALIGKINGKTATSSLKITTHL
jgi:hypothetical protein